MSAKHCVTHHECDCIAAHRVEMGATIQKLREALEQADKILDEYHRKHGVPRGNMATRKALLATTRQASEKKE